MARDYNGAVARCRAGVSALRCLVHNKQIVYNIFVIRSFADKETESLFATKQSRRLPPDIVRRALKRLNQLDSATGLDDLKFPPSNRLELLKGDRAGRWSLRINDQWRLCFRFDGANALDVEIVDYH